MNSPRFSSIFRFSVAAVGIAAAKKAEEDDNKKELLGDEEMAPQRKPQEHLPIPTGRERRFDKSKHSTPDFRHVVVTDEMQTKRSVGDIPIAPIGIAATIIALLYMFRSFYKGDKNAMLLSMQYRIIAQSLTVLSLVLGTWYLQIKSSSSSDTDK